MYIKGRLHTILLTHFEQMFVTNPNMFSSLTNLNWNTILVLLVQLEKIRISWKCSFFII